MTGNAKFTAAMEVSCAASGWVGAGDYIEASGRAR